MKAVFTYLMILTLSCYALASCSTTNSATKPTAQNTSEQNSSPLLGDYHYSSYDQKGERVVEGTLSITSVERKRIYADEVTQVKGNWKLEKVGHQERIGSQEGTGELVGSIKDGELIINLNPNIDDANVYLRGRVEGKRYKGSWSFRGYAGTISEGTFEAIKKVGEE
ncbi:MAG TPA: hypothetical protein VF766_16135 [Pyrinomonadaceae bacterium]